MLAAFLGDLAMRRIAIAVCTALSASPRNAGDRITGKPFATRSAVIAPHGMVATSHPLAAQVGLDVLKKGGNAVDAAIAANAALGLMEPMSCGIGGDLFAIVWDAKTKKLYGLNASGRSPNIATLQYFAGQGLKRNPAARARCRSVPGCVDGWDALHDKLRHAAAEGRLLAPAIALRARRLPGHRGHRRLLAALGADA